MNTIYKGKIDIENLACVYSTKVKLGQPTSSISLLFKLLMLLEICTQYYQKEIPGSQGQILPFNNIKPFPFNKTIVFQLNKYLLLFTKKSS